jgi:biopolymer transport protein ExbD
MIRPKGPAVEESVSPNLIPMIDIMFLLLLFFMLGADMGQRELEDVVVPEAQTAHPLAPEIAKDWTTINVYHRQSHLCAAYRAGTFCREASHWKYGVRGHEVESDQALAELLKRSDPGLPGPASESRTVLIRADAQSPYGLAQRAINVCAQAGWTRVEVSASSPGPGMGR